MDYATIAQAYTEWIDYPGYELARDFTREEYELRVKRAREEMAKADLDALVITSGAVGHWFTSFTEPHEWHDRCQVRSAWYILTQTGDYLYMTPSAGGEHFNTTRRCTWVGEIRAIVERTQWPRWEIWAIEQMPLIFADLGVERGRLGFELGDCMTLGMSFNDFLRLRELMPEAQLVDGSPVLRRLMSIHTPEEIERVRRACEAGVWIHEQVVNVLRPGMSEREFVARMNETFQRRYGLEGGYCYRGDGAWDVRNAEAGDSNFFHAAVTDRVFKKGDVLCRSFSGVWYRGYGGDVDRVWAIGQPREEVLRYYRTCWECNQAMAEMVRPGNLCSDIYRVCDSVEQRNGLPKRLTGRVGHGLRNLGLLSVHPDNHTVLEPGMIISVEPMFGHEYGWYDLEDQYLVTETGSEILGTAAPEHMPVVPA